MRERIKRPSTMNTPKSKPASTGARYLHGQSTGSSQSAEHEADEMANKVTSPATAHVPRPAIDFSKIRPFPENAPTPGLPPWRAPALTGGRPLDPVSRSYFEPRVGVDLDNVRVHDNKAAHEAAAALNSHAFTVGNHIGFADGKHEPNTPSGQNLIAHELAHVVQQARTGAIAVQRKAKADTPSTSPSLQEASLVIQAIVDILDQYDEALGIVFVDAKAEQHEEVPAEGRPLLAEWNLIVRGKRQTDAGPVISISGQFLQAHLAMALAKTESFLAVLRRHRVGADTMLMQRFDAQVQHIKARALEQEVSESIEKAAETAKQSLPGLDTKTEEEKLKIGVSEALKTVRTTSTVVNRFLSDAVKRGLEPAKLQVLFHQITQDALKSGKTLGTGVLQPAVEMNIPSALVFVKATLDGMNGILSVSDPTKRAKLFSTHFHTAAGEIVRDTELLTVLGQALSGAVAISGAATFAVASHMGKTGLAAQLLTKGIPALGNLNLTLNAIGVIHGTATLLDNEASGEKKAAAALEVTVSGAGVLGKFVPAFAPYAAPFTLTAVVNFYAVKAVLEKAAEGYADLVRLGLNICFADMREIAKRVAETGLRVAIAGQMAIDESSPDRKPELDAQLKGLMANLVDIWLKPYIARATTASGASNKDPGAYGPALINRFTPLVGRPMTSTEEALSVAHDFIDIVAKCFAEPEKILSEVARWAWRRNQ